MKSTNPSSTGDANINTTQESTRGRDPSTPPGIRTTGREYENPVDYQHPYPSMSQFADFLALRYDANRTRHAYYRQIRLIHEHVATDPVAITEAQAPASSMSLKTLSPSAGKTVPTPTGPND